MPALVLRDNFQAGANRESHQRDEGILIANTVHIVVACAPDQLADSLVTAKKRLQNDGFYLLGRFYLFGGARTGSPRVRSNIGAYEPAAQPAQVDFFDGSVLAAFQRNRNRWQKDFIRDAEVLQALTYTPRTLAGLPVELNSTESFCQRFRAPISDVQFRDKAQRPIGWSGHSPG